MKLDSYTNSCAFAIIIHMLAAGRNNDLCSEKKSAKALSPQTRIAIQSLNFTGVRLFRYSFLELRLL